MSYYGYENVGDKIYDYMLANPGCTQKDIREGTKASMAAISAAVTVLVRAEMAVTSKEKRGPGYASTTYTLVTLTPVKVESPWDPK